LKPPSCATLTELDCVPEFHGRLNRSGPHLTSCINPPSRACQIAHCIRAVRSGASSCESRPNASPGLPKMVHALPEPFFAGPPLGGTQKGAEKSRGLPTNVLGQRSPRRGCELLETSATPRANRRRLLRLHHSTVRAKLLAPNGRPSGGAGHYTCYSGLARTALSKRGSQRASVPRTLGEYFRTGGPGTAYHPQNGSAMQGTRSGFGVVPSADQPLREWDADLGIMQYQRSSNALAMWPTPAPFCFAWRFDDDDPAGGGRESDPTPAFASAWGSGETFLQSVGPENARIRDARDAG
jgi:hypothetical protein